MTEAERLANTLKQTWGNTNRLNWDALEQELRRCEIAINSGMIDSVLIDTYLTIKEAYKLKFGGAK